MSLVRSIAWAWDEALGSIDPLLLVGELFALVLGVAGFQAGLNNLRGPSRAWVVGYDELVTFCQQRGISLAEVAALTTTAAGLVAFDVFVTLAEDDTLEAISYGFICSILAAVLLLGLAVDIQYYYLVSCVSGGEASLRLLYTDLVNNGLCLLRVVFCWVRYLFYDLQSELVDFVFHYTEVADEVSLEAVGAGAERSVGAGVWAGLGGWAGLILSFFFDVTVLLLQALLGAFKLALALFLF